VVGLSAPALMQMLRQPELYRLVCRFDLVVPDGQGVVWAARVLGLPINGRLAIPDLVEFLFSLAQAEGYKVFLLGAEEAVNRRAAENVLRRYPELILAGRQHGYYPPEAEEQVARSLSASQPDILVVGMPSPHKERFILRWGQELCIPICIAAGGYLDVLGGKTKRAPEWMQRAGLEWLFRVVQEPRRLWRRVFVANLVFPLYVLAEALGVRRYDRPRID